MRQLLKKIPLVVDARRLARRIRKSYDLRFGPARLRKMVATAPSKRIMIGAGLKEEPGWTRTQVEFLDLLRPADWERFFEPGTLDAMLAEHVWEHLTVEQGVQAARTCFTYLKPGGYLRLAVPDGNHPDPAYIGVVKVVGASPIQIANDHKVLYTYPLLKDVLEQAGFRVVPYEYFDESGTFHYHEWDPKHGKIWRSKRFDRRNQNGRLAFTSIVVDAVKDLRPERRPDSAARSGSHIPLTP
jgi:predicted SAM-dependent methyltransferase